MCNPQCGTRRHTIPIASNASQPPNHPIADRPSVPSDRRDDDRYRAKELSLKIEPYLRARPSKIYPSNDDN
jgi:hypothetical protein